MVHAVFHFAVSSASFAFRRRAASGFDVLRGLLIGGSLDGIASILLLKSLKTSDMSLVIPLLSFTPLFVALASPLLVNEFPSIYGAFGIALITAGSYILNISHLKKGVLEPFRELLRNRGALLMIVVAFIWGVTSNIDKIAVQHSSPVFFTVAFNIYLSLFLLIPLFLYAKDRNVMSSLKSLLPIGFFSAAELVSQMFAISLFLVSYVVSLKFTSILFGVLYGHFFFREKNTGERFLGAVLMMIGIALTILS